MGCGASKGSDSSAAVPQQKQPETKPIQAAAPATKATEPGPPPTSDSSIKKDGSLVKQSSAKVDSDYRTTQFVDAVGPVVVQEGNGQASPEKPSAASGSLEQDAAGISTPDRSAGDEVENPARTAFRSTFQSLKSTECSPSPADDRGVPPADERGPSITFKSSRSLNRSIGVRRRTSDSGGNGEPGSDGNAPARRIDPEDEDVMKSPDSVLEKFEKTKGVNPLLRKATEKSIAAPSQKTQKRLAVGFALEGAGADGAVGAAVEVRVQGPDS